MFHYTGDAQVNQLGYLEQGQLMTIILTGVADVPVLEFQHAGDTTWRKHPGFDGTITDDVIIQEVRCISGSMRLNFAGQPASDYWLSTVYAATPTF